MKTIVAPLVLLILLPSLDVQAGYFEDYSGNTEHYAWSWADNLDPNGFTTAITNGAVTATANASILAGGSQYLGAFQTEFSAADAVVGAKINATTGQGNCYRGIMLRADPVNSTMYGLDYDNIIDWEHNSQNLARFDLLRFDGLVAGNLSYENGPYYYKTVEGTPGTEHDATYITELLMIGSLLRAAVYDTSGNRIVLERFPRAGAPDPTPGVLVYYMERETAGDAIKYSASGNTGIFGAGNANFLQNLPPFPPDPIVFTCDNVWGTNVGDLDGNGSIGAADRAIVLANWNHQCIDPLAGLYTPTLRYADGDINLDGIINGADWALVPEPATLFLLSAPILGLRTKRKSQPRFSRMGRP
jgi:hypothetical protein